MKRKSPVKETVREGLKPTNLSPRARPRPVSVIPVPRMPVYNRNRSGA